MFDDDGLFTPCHSDMEGTEGVKWGLGSSVRSGLKVIKHLILAKYDILWQY